MEADDREEVPRISVDNLYDWERIKKSYEDAAYSQLDARTQGQSKEDRERLRAAMQKIVERTFEMCKPNLRVNGRNFEDLNAEEQGIEPFDEGLDRHIWSLSDQRLQWNGEIARKRREKPREVHRLMKELLETQQAVDEMEKEEYEAVELAEGEAEPDLSDETYENINETVKKTFAMVEELQQSVRLQHERTERLKVVTAEIKALKP
ncbi:hypothetical protein PHLGIDRAFT_112510 [Phlebiopsis gigantea 11061_1 CR5-6]|uniref:Uncharacterized protein n=1 Tax=Phlebiopsis gigantea (strain 11061_1 CR5-6) TaxID=745531 RepID=A0A0C3PAX1_PHLG1|nr:hypothetical protein PHLGIDRAFT_112510 [Phlebiopsis gigantea 11061_1 CR5-6]